MLQADDTDVHLSHILWSGSYILYSILILQPLTCLTGESLYIHGVQFCMLTIGTFEILKDTEHLKCAKYDNSRLKIYGSKYSKFVCSVHCTKTVEYDKMSNPFSLFAITDIKNFKNENL